jgi:HAD superfamily hydrolase (TIGR01549 family)
MSARFVTFDVWDTLLRRRCDPEATKLFTCWSLILLGGSELARPYHDVWAVLRLRNVIERELAEQNIAQGFDGEYRLTDVLAMLVSRTRHGNENDPSNANPDGLSRLAYELYRVETLQEHFVTYPDASIAAVIAEHAGSELGYISDFYMGADELSGLLRAHGFGSIAKRGFVSSDIGLNKRSGRLFGHVQTQLGINPAHWTHVGDNAIADIANAQRLGITTHHHRPPSEDEQRMQIARGFGRPHVILRDAFLAARHDAVQTAENASTDNVEMQNLGIEAAPLFVGFAHWLLEWAVHHRSEQIYFVDGSGAFLQALYQRTAAVFADVWPEVPNALLSLAELSAMANSASTDGIRVPFQLKRRITLVAIRTCGQALEDLARTMPDTEFQALYLALEKNHSPCPSNVEQRGYAVDLNRSSAHKRLLSFLAPVRVLSGLSARDAAHMTDLASTKITFADFDRLVVPFQMNCLNATHNIAKEFRTHAITSNDSRPHAVRAWWRLIFSQQLKMTNATRRAAIDRILGDALSRQPLQRISDRAHWLLDTAIDMVQPPRWRQTRSSLTRQLWSHHFIRPLISRAAPLARRTQRHLRKLFAAGPK